MVIISGSSYYVHVRLSPTISPTWNPQVVYSKMDVKIVLHASVTKLHGAMLKAKIEERGGKVLQNVSEIQTWDDCCFLVVSQQFAKSKRFPKGIDENVHAVTLSCRIRGWQYSGRDKNNFVSKFLRSQFITENSVPVVVIPCQRDDESGEAAGVFVEGRQIGWIEARKNQIAMTALAKSSNNILTGNITGFLGSGAYTQITASIKL